MQQLAPAGFPGSAICSVTPLRASGKMALCQVAENGGCPFAMTLNHLTLCQHPESHLFRKSNSEAKPEIRLKRIMVVDHNLNLMHQMAAVLRNAGYEVIESDDGDLSLKVLEEWSHMHIDLVITDTRMQGILRQSFLDLRPNTRVLFVSDQPRARLGLRDELPFLPKPFTSVDLLKQVIGLIGKQAA